MHVRLTRFPGLQPRKAPWSSMADCTASLRFEKCMLRVSGTSAVCRQQTTISVLSSLLQPRRHLLTSSTVHTAGLEAEDEDELTGVEIEILSAEGGITDAAGVGSVGAAPSAATATTRDTQGRGAESESFVRVLDPYARAALSNYIVRATAAMTADNDGDHTSNNTYNVTVREVEGGDGGGSSGSRWHARQRLPLPAAYGVRIAEGFAPTFKEAETVCAMHALRILDALGLPIFQLSSKQQRHAQAAHAAGRHSPLPGDPSQPPSTPSPPPLHYAAESAVASVERRLGLGSVAFLTVTTGVLTPFRHTLASPYFLDRRSVRRVRLFFHSHGATMERDATVTALRSDTEAEPTAYVAQLRLPLPPRFGDRTCVGRAPTRRDAVALACMHAELTIDALGLPLYPLDADAQRRHAEECAMVGRCCVAPGVDASRYDTATPPPLQLAAAAVMHGASAGTAGGVGSYTSASSSTATAMPVISTAEVVRGGVDSVEAVLVQHTRAVADVSRVVDVEHLAEGALPLLRHYLAHHNMGRLASGAASNDSGSDTTASFATWPCFVETLGVKHHETYRATVTVPLPPPPAGQRGDGLGEGFVAIGVASASAAQAELAAALHAVRALAAMNRPIAFTPEAQGVLRGVALSAAIGAALPMHDPSRPALLPRDLASATGAAAALMLPVRCISSVHLGRVLGPGLAGNKESTAAASGRAGSCRTPETTQVTAVTTGDRGGRLPSIGSWAAPTPVRLRDEERVAEILRTQARLPRSDWSLAPDAAARIVVDPAATAAGGRNYVHTLPAVRTPDIFAINRLRDYLERHGKQLATSVVHRVRDVDESETASPYRSRRSSNDCSGDLRSNHSRRSAKGVGGSSTRGLPRLQLHTVTCVLPTRVRAEAATASQAPTEDPSSAATSTATAAARVMAQGEAYNEEDALLMCAMHAELLLDALGIPLYDHPELQRRHADTARMLGRWAPMAAGALAPAALATVPPPVRKEHAHSYLWSRLQLRGAEPQQPRGAEAAAVVAQPLVLSRAAPSPRPETRTPAVLNGAAACTTAATPANAVPADAPPTDDELCDFARLQFIHPTEIFRVAARHVQAYYRGRGSDFYRCVRQYTTPTPGHGNVHRAIAELPVPAPYGRRFAVGCADTKRRALAVCATHAAWTLEALGLPIYSGKRQDDYARASRLRGRQAPRPGEPARAPDTPSPPGLCCLSGAAMTDVDSLEAPQLPDTAAMLADPQVWSVYVRACRTFIDKAHEAQLHEALFERNEAPRSDIDVEDDTLAVVEQAPIDPRAKQRLAGVCARFGLPAPMLPLRYDVYGRAPEKRFLTQAAVLGTPYVARGFGRTPAETLARAAMHYERIVTTAINGQTGTKRHGAAAASSVAPAGVSAAAGNGPTMHSEPSPAAGMRGKLPIALQETAIGLYAASHPPFQPLQVVTAATVATAAGVNTSVSSGGRHCRHETSGSSPAAAGSTPPPARAATVAIATLHDDKGLLLQARSGPRPHVATAVDEAIGKLFALLEPRAPFQVLTHLLRRHPQLRTGATAAAPRLAEALRATPAEGNSSSLTNVASTLIPPSPSSAPPSRVPLPRVCSAAEVLQELVADSSAAACASGMAATLSSHLAELLIELAGGSLSGEMSPVLVLPAAARDTLPRMGLMRTCKAGTDTDGSTAIIAAAAASEDVPTSWVLTPLGVVTARLLGCLPPRPSVALEGGQRFVAGPLLPMQLAKLLILGALLNGRDLDRPRATVNPSIAACRIVSLAACGVVATTASPSTEQAGGLASEDIVLHAMSTLRGEIALPPVVAAYESQLCERLRTLATAAEKNRSRLAAVLEPYAAAPPSGGTVLLAGANDGDVDAVLRLCMAAATFPDVWTARSSVAAERWGPVLATSVESRDALRTALVCTPLASSPDTSNSSSPSASSPPLCYAAFDCAIVRDAHPPVHAMPASTHSSAASSKVGAPLSLVRQVPRALRQHYGHMWLCGAAVSPLASLAAAGFGMATGDSSGRSTMAAVLRADTDADRVALLYDGTVAIVARSAGVVQGLQDLQCAFATAMEALEPVGAGGDSGSEGSAGLLTRLLTVASTPLEPVTHFHARCTEEGTLAAYVAEHRV